MCPIITSSYIIIHHNYITSSLLFIIIASYTHFTIVPDDTPVEALLGTVGGTEDATWAPSRGVAEEDHPGRHQGPYHTKVRERKGERRMVEGGSKVVGGHMVLIKYILPPSLPTHTLPAPNLVGVVQPCVLTGRPHSSPCTC